MMSYASHVRKGVGVYVYTTTNFKTFENSLLKQHHVHGSRARDESYCSQCKHICNITDETTAFCWGENRALRSSLSLLLPLG